MLMDRGLRKYLGLDEWNEAEHPRDDRGRFTDSVQGKINSVKIDFTRDNILPELNEEDLAKIGVKSVPVRLKAKIIERNKRNHRDLSERESEHIIKQALYEPEIIIPAKGENYFHFIAKAEEKDSPLVLLDAEIKDGYFDIVHYFKVRPRSKEKLIKR